MTKGYRTFVKLSPYELILLRKLRKDLNQRAADAAAAEGKVKYKKLSISDIVRACVRTAIHTVYGDDYAYKELLGESDFQKMMGKIELPPDPSP